MEAAVDLVNSLSLSEDDSEKSLTSSDKSGSKVSYKTRKLEQKLRKYELALKKHDNINRVASSQVK